MLLHLHLLSLRRRLTDQGESQRPVRICKPISNGALQEGLHELLTIERVPTLYPYLRQCQALIDLVRISTPSTTWQDLLDQQDRPVAIPLRAKNSGQN